MTRDEIMRMAQSCWILDKHDCSDDWFVRADADVEEIIKFGELIAAAEREECACEAEGISNSIHGYDKHGYAEAIRARGDK